MFLSPSKLADAYIINEYSIKHDTYGTVFNIPNPPPVPLPGGVPRKSPIQLAGCGGHLAVMSELVRKGYNWKEKDDWGWTIMHEVGAAGFAAGIKWVSQHCQGLANIQDKLGEA